MARCDQMKSGEIYSCEDCGFGFQVISESRHAEKLEQGACALDMTCCDRPLVLTGHGSGQVEGTGGPHYITQPLQGSG